MILDYDKLKSEIGHRFIVESGNIAHPAALRDITAMLTMIHMEIPNRTVIYDILTEPNRIQRDAERLPPRDLADMPKLREIAALVLADVLGKKQPSSIRPPDP